MKNLLYLLTLALAFTACNRTEPEPAKPFKLDPLATVNIKPEMGAWGAAKAPAATEGAAQQDYLSARDIVKKATVLQFHNPNIIPNTELWERGFDKLQRDTVSETPALKMWATDIISEEGKYVTEFIEGYDMILLHFRTMTPDAIRDTIGYIPNSVMRAAEAATKKAYNERNMDEVLRIFNEAFTFRPTTGAEYRALKAAGNQ